MYIKVTFPTFDKNTEYEFSLPINAGNGGIVYLDGEIMTQTNGIYERQPTSALSFTATVSDGNHLLEVYAASDCCDTTTTWKFNVNATNRVGGKVWQRFITASFNEYLTTMYDPEEFYHKPEDWDDPCDGLKGFDEECRGLSGWHYTTNADKTSVWDVCAVLVTTNGTTCKDYCEG
jgi:hypothetical protein